MQRQTEIRPALDALEDRLVTIDGPQGKLLDVPGAVVVEDDAAALPQLLPMWDSTLLAYKDRSRIVPEEYRKLVIRRNGDVLPTLLVVGVWRPVAGGIEATAFEPLADDTGDGLAAEVFSLVTMLADREPLVYSRYGKWWNGMPGERRILPG